jgi:hypothetical protein
MENESMDTTDSESLNSLCDSFNSVAVFCNMEILQDSVFESRRLIGEYPENYLIGKNVGKFLLETSKRYLLYIKKCIFENSKLEYLCTFLDRYQYLMDGTTSNFEYELLTTSYYIDTTILDYIRD